MTKAGWGCEEWCYTILFYGMVISALILVMANILAPDEPVGAAILERAEVLREREQSYGPKDYPIEKVLRAFQRRAHDATGAGCRVLKECSGQQLANIARGRGWFIGKKLGALGTMSAHCWSYVAGQTEIADFEPQCFFFSLYRFEGADRAAGSNAEI